MHMEPKGTAALETCTYQVLVSSVHGQVAKSDRYGSHNFVHI